MDKLYVLGTGTASCVDSYNTCFVLEDKNHDYLLVDAGGGNGIFKQLKSLDIDYLNIHNIFVTHKHIDHMLGVIWLYRNIEYIKANQGKERTLKILAENLLGDAFVSLLYKNMHQNITNYSSKLVTKPEFISYSYLTNTPEKIEQVEDLNSRLFDQGIEYRNNSEYVENL